jgi:hypothetical protein
MTFVASWLVFVAAILAGAIAAVSGFGIGSLLTPLLVALSFQTADAVAILAIPHAVATAIRWVRLRSQVHLPTFRQFGIASAAGGLAGALLQSRMGGSLLTALLATLLLIAGTTELVRRPIPLPTTPFWRLFGGFLSGIFGGLVGNQGGIRSAALLGFRLSPIVLVATATASALLVDAARVPIYLYTARDVIARAVSLELLVAAGVTIGTFIGVPILGRLPPSTYRRLVGALLVTLGISLLVQL